MPATIVDETYDRCMSESDGTNTARSQCGAEWVEREDSRLDSVWDTLMTRVEGDERIWLVDEQRSWINARAQGCSIYLNGVYDREVDMLDRQSCLARATRLRTGILGNILNSLGA